VISSIDGTCSKLYSVFPVSVEVLMYMQTYFVNGIFEDLFYMQNSAKIGH
jgi:hypothetical protein